MSSTRTSSTRPKYYSVKDKDNEGEEQIRKDFRTKCRFRACVRKVIANYYWLIQGIDDYEGLEDVKRRVQQAVRGKKKQQLLSIADKALLNKPANERTDEERIYLFKIIGDLKCFRRYPTNVKKKLAAVTYYRYYGPGRTLVRQDHEAHAMYFIISGSVVVSRTVYDEVLQEVILLQVGDMRAGDMFGEISLLHNIKRTATVSTTDHCELLALLKPDFKAVLQYSIKKQWDEVLKAMTSFTYFDALDDVAKREGCLLAQLKSFNANEVILGDNAGVPNFVYFTLSGQCQIVESLRVRVKTKHSKKFYSLYDPYVPEEGDEIENAELNLDKYFARYKNKLKELESIDYSNTRKKSEVRKHSVYYVPVGQSNKEHLLSTHNNLFIKQDDPRIMRRNSSTRYSVILTADDNQSRGELSYRTLDRVIIDTASFLSKSTIDLKDPSTLNLRNPKSSSLITNYHSCRLLPDDPHLSHLKTVFMQVCLLKAGSCFGFGEDLRDRRIIAVNKVNCMLLPKVWLLQRNTTNIWTRILHFLQKRMPTKKMIFDEFVTARRWADYREKVLNELVSGSKAISHTTIHDVPYSIRIQEMYDQDI